MSETIGSLLGIRSRGVGEYDMGEVIVSVKFWVSVLGLVVASTILGSSMAYAGGGGAAEPRDTAGLFRSGIWYLRSSNDPACASPQINVGGFGASTDIPLARDFDGDGIDQITVFRTTAGFGEFFTVTDNPPAAPGAILQTSFGAPGDLPVIGDFDTATPGDEVGIYRPSTQEFFLDDGGPSPLSFGFGDAGDVPIAGNWDNSADGSDEVGVYRASDNTFYLRADNIPGASSVDARPMGAAGDLGVVGDFDRDGRTTIGVFRGVGFGGWFLNNMATGQGVDVQLNYGAGTDVPAMGDWDGPSVDEAGC